MFDFSLFPSQTHKQQFVRNLITLIKSRNIGTQSMTYDIEDSTIQAIYQDWDQYRPQSDQEKLARLTRVRILTKRQLAEKYNLPLPTIQAIILNRQSQSRNLELATKIKLTREWQIKNRELFNQKKKLEQQIKQLKQEVGEIRFKIMVHNGKLA